MDQSCLHISSLLAWLLRLLGRCGRRQSEGTSERNQQGLQAAGSQIRRRIDMVSLQLTPAAENSGKDRHAMIAHSMFLSSSNQCEVLHSIHEAV